MSASAFMLTTNTGAGGGVAVEGVGGVSRPIENDYVIGLDAAGSTGAVSGVDGDLWDASVTARGGWKRAQLTTSFGARHSPAFSQRRGSLGARLASRRFGRVAVHVTPLARIETHASPGAERREFDLMTAGGSWEGRRGPMILRLRVERGAADDGAASAAYAHSGVEFAVGTKYGSFGLAIDSEGLAVNEETTSCTTIGLRMALDL